MKTTNPHSHSSPEQLEALLTQKAFVELNDAERAYALEHLESEEEYASMRALLLGISATPAETVAPRAGTKEALMDLFPTEERGGFRVWLNSSWALLVRPQELWQRQPAIGIAFVAITAVVAGVLLFQHSPNEMAYAEQLIEPEDEIQADQANSTAHPSEDTNDRHVEEAYTGADEKAAENKHHNRETDAPAALPNMEDARVEHPQVWEAIAEEEADDQSMVLDFEVEADVESIDGIQATIDSTNAGSPSYLTNDSPSIAGNHSPQEETDLDELAELKSFSIPATELDAKATFQSASPVDESLFNTYTQSELDQKHLNQIETLSGVSTNVTEITTNASTSSRGLDVTFSAGEYTMLGERATQYSALFELMETSW